MRTRHQEHQDRLEEVRQADELEQGKAQGSKKAKQKLHSKADHVVQKGSQQPSKKRKDHPSESDSQLNDTASALEPSIESRGRNISARKQPSEKQQTPKQRSSARKSSARKSSKKPGLVGQGEATDSGVEASKVELTGTRGNEESDDEGPEEVAHGTAKSEAAMLAKVEAAEQQLAKQARQRRKRKSSENAFQGSAADDSQTVEHTMPSEQLKKSVVSMTDDDNDELDYLPESIIHAIQTQQREPVAVEIPGTAPSTTALANQISEVSPRATALTFEEDSEEEADELEEAKGRRIVRLLDSRPSFKPSAAAKSYLEQKLQGSRLQRSKAMLTFKQPAPKTQWPKFARRGILS